MRMCLRSCMHIYLGISMHKYLYILRAINMKQAPIHIQIYMYVYMVKGALTCVYTCIHNYASLCACVQICFYIYPTFVYTYIYSYMQMYIRTDVHMHMYISYNCVYISTIIHSRRPQLVSFFDAIPCRPLVCQATPCSTRSCDATSHHVAYGFCTRLLP